MFPSALGAVVAAVLVHDVVVAFEHTAQEPAKVHLNVEAEAVLMEVGSCFFERQDVKYEPLF